MSNAVIGNTRFFRSNMNTVDRAARGTAGVILVLISPLGLDLLRSGTLAWFVLFFGAANIIAALTRWCFMYSLVGLSSLNGKAELESQQSSEIPKLNLVSLRWKATLALSTIAIILASLFVAEATRSALDTAKAKEIEGLHETTLLISRQLEISLLQQAELKETDFEQTIAKTLEPFTAPVFIFVTGNQTSVLVTKNLYETDETELRQHLTDLEIPESVFMPAGRHTIDSQSAITAHLSAYELISLQNADFILMPHTVFASNEEPLKLILGHETTTRKEVIFSVISRLALPTMILWWLSIWGAIGTTYFLFRYINRANQTIYNFATIDTASGLPNALALQQKMEDKSLFNADANLRICAMDLRNLNVIESNTDSVVVNELLLKLADNLRELSVPEDQLCRLTPNVILLIAPEEEITLFERYRTIVNETLWVREFQFTLEPTEIILNYPIDVQDFESLRIAVSKLVIAAKQMNLSSLRYDISLLESTDRRSKYAYELNRALNNREFELYLQPKVDLTSCELVGAEALVRWNHPEDGLLTPEKFLDLIESSNVRSNFARYVIAEAARFADELNLAGHAIPISFNLSAHDLFDSEVQAYLAVVSKKLLLKEIPVLEIELTETQTSINTSRITEAMHLLKWLGYTLALDDFGTGMSSLSYSAELPVHTIKIDKSFVDRMNLSGAGETSIKAILLLAQGFNYSVVAEGIETAQQAIQLKQLGCHTAQGYLFAKPMRYSEFRRYASNEIQLPNYATFESDT